MKVKDFDFDLPKELIAQEPVEPRDRARLLCYWKESGKIEHRFFYELAQFFEPGDAIVLNNTKVIPARLNAVKASGGKVKILLLKKIDDFEWEALASGKLKGEQFELSVGKHKVLLLKASERWLCRAKNLEEIMREHGKMPLPPYIKKEIEKPEQYQTVYCEVEGSIAAPTAGLHFTPELIKKLEEKNVKIVYITLHVGYGTFHIPSCEEVEEHRMEEEWYEVSCQAAEAINAASRAGKKICCVGTTTMRALESASKDMRVYPGSGMSKVFIYPGYKFQSPVNAFITNFHLPKSTPLFLTSAIVGRERLMEIYKIAISNGYRFFSFGDAMAVWP